MELHPQLTLQIAFLVHRAIQRQGCMLELRARRNLDLVAMCDSIEYQTSLELVINHQLGNLDMRFHFRLAQQTRCL